MSRGEVVQELELMMAAVGQMKDGELLVGLRNQVACHRAATAHMLAHIGEVDARKLYRGQACSSMFTYCVERLHMSEPGAFRRIHAARVARQFPLVLAMVATGELHLSAIKLLSPHLTDENHRELLGEARHASKRQIERQLARRFPGEPAPSAIRRTTVRPVVAAAHRNEGHHETAAERPAGERELPEPAAGTQPSLFARQPATEVAVPVEEREQYTVTFTADRQLHDKLRQAQELMRHRNPDGDLALVVDRALTALLAELHKQRFGRKKRAVMESNTKAARAPTGPNAEGESQPVGPSPSGSAPRSRHIPNQVKRAVVERDGLRCTFVNAQGRRCSATGFLELHHLHPFALEGEHSTENVTVYCATHNRYAAEIDLGIKSTERQRHMMDGGRNPSGSPGTGS